VSWLRCCEIETDSRSLPARPCVRRCEIETGYSGPACRLPCSWSGSPGPRRRVGSTVSELPGAVPSGL